MTPEEKACVAVVRIGRECPELADGLHAVAHRGGSNPLVSIIAEVIRQAVAAERERIARTASAARATYERVDNARPGVVSVVSVHHYADRIRGESP